MEREYGLSQKYDDIVISTTLNKWIELLYSNEYHIKSGEVINLFNSKKMEQSAIRKKYSNQGIHVSLKNWRHVVLDDILDSLPNYS